MAKTTEPPKPKILKARAGENLTFHLSSGISAAGELQYERDTP